MDDCYAVDCRNGVIDPQTNGTLQAKSNGGQSLNLNNVVMTPVAAYCIGSYESNAWKSGNPYSGVYETEIAKTLDALNCGYPACNQGGTAIVETYSDERNKE